MLKVITNVYYNSCTITLHKLQKYFYPYKFTVSLLKKCVKLKEITYFMKFVKMEFSFLLNATMVTSTDQICLYYCTRCSGIVYKYHQLQHWLSHSTVRMKNA